MLNSVFPFFRFSYCILHVCLSDKETLSLAPNFKDDWSIDVTDSINQMTCLKRRLSCLRIFGQTIANL